jgi:hypothetical protein
MERGKEKEKQKQELQFATIVDAVELAKAARACLPYISNLRARRRLGLALATIIPKIKRLGADDDAN